MSMKYSARVILTVLFLAVIAIGAFAWRAVDADSWNQAPELGWTLVPVAEREIAFRIPAGWTEQAPNIAYTDLQAALTLGLDHAIAIPQHPASDLLPAGYDLIDAGYINLGWAEATRYVLQNAGGAQIRIVAQVDENVYAFYLSGRSLNQVEAHEALLAQMVDSVVLAENTPEGLAIFNP